MGCSCHFCSHKDFCNLLEALWTNWQRKLVSWSLLYFHWKPKYNISLHWKGENRCRLSQINIHVHELNITWHSPGLVVGGLLGFCRKGWKAWTLLLQRQKIWFFHRPGSDFCFTFTRNPLSSAEAIPPRLPSKGWSSELMAALAATCSLAVSKYSSKCICSSVICWNGSTPTQKAACSFRESIMMNEMSFKWEKGGVVGVSPIVHPLWDWHLHDLVIKSIWMYYAEVI